MIIHSSRQQDFADKGSPEICKRKKGLIYFLDRFRDNINHKSPIDYWKYEIIEKEDEFNDICTYSLEIYGGTETFKTCMIQKTTAVNISVDVTGISEIQRIDLWHELLTEIMGYGFSRIYDLSKMLYHRRQLDEVEKVLTPEEAIEKMSKEPLQLVYDNELTKREQIAAMALQGLLANSDWVKTAQIPNDWDEFKERSTISAVEFTDELLKQLNKKSS